MSSNTPSSYDASWDFFQENFDMSSVGSGDGNAKLPGVLNINRIKAIASALRVIGDDLDASYKKRKILHRQRLDATTTTSRYEKIKEGFGKLVECFRKVVNVVDAVLEWLEKTSADMMDNLEKQEGVLRGLTQIAELANQVGSVAVVRLTCSYLGNRGAPYVAERHFISDCLEAISTQQDTITSEVESACSVLEEIIATAWDSAKALVFDNHVRKANLAISSCKKRLDEVSKKNSELLFKMNSVKWFHRGLRCFGAGISCYFLYELYENGKINTPTALGSGAVSIIMWFAMFPTEIYEGCTDLKKLESRHRALSLRLDELATELKSADDYHKTVKCNSTI